MRRVSLCREQKKAEEAQLRLQENMFMFHDVIHLIHLLFPKQALQFCYLHPALLKTKERSGLQKSFELCWDSGNEQNLVLCWNNRIWKKIIFVKH